MEEAAEASVGIVQMGSDVAESYGHDWDVGYGWDRWSGSPGAGFDELESDQEGGSRDNVIERFDLFRMFVDLDVP